MTQKNGVGLKVKAEKGSGKYWGGGWVFSKRKSPQEMEVGWMGLL